MPCSAAWTGTLVVICALALVAESATAIATTANVFTATSPELNANLNLANDWLEIMTASRTLSPLRPRPCPLALGRGVGARVTRAKVKAHVSPLSARRSRAGNIGNEVASFHFRQRSRDGACTIDEEFGERIERPVL
jgi:hypothetical protein